MDEIKKGTSEDAPFSEENDLLDHIKKLCKQSPRGR